MGRKHFTEDQIAFPLRQHDGGMAVADIIRKLGISEQTFYRWKKRYAGLGVAERRRLKQLEEENRKLMQSWWPINLRPRKLRPGRYASSRRFRVA